MSEEPKRTEEMMEDYENLIDESLQQPQKGDIIKATVVQINDSDILFNISYKTEGVVSIEEFEKTLSLGDEYDLAVVAVPRTGYVQLSYKSTKEKSDWEDIKAAHENNTPVEVKVLNYIDKEKGKGYVGKVGTIDVFIPDNHIDTRLKGIDPKTYIGKKLLAKVLKIKTSSGNNRRTRSALVSPRLYAQEALTKARNEFLANIKLGDKLKGTIKTIKDYGAFVNFGDVDGFLHKNEICYGHVGNPAKYLTEGQKVEVEVIELEPAENRLAVSLKKLQADPWDKASTEYPVGSNVEGTVVSRKRAGYVLEIAQGINGFVPNEEISWLKNTRSSLNIKDVVSGRVLDYDNNHKRIIISVKDLKENPWSALRKSDPEGSVIKGKIKNVTDFGLFVDFGSFIDGLIRKGDISWTEEPANLADTYKAGDEIEAKILHIDEEKERVSLGIKQLEQNPWKELGKLLPAGKAVEVPISNISKQGLEVELPLGLKGFIAIADLDPANPSLEQFKIGDKVNAIVIKTDAKDKNVVLSIKKYLHDSDKRETREYMKKQADTDNSFSNSAFIDQLKKMK